MKWLSWAADALLLAPFTPVHAWLPFSVRLCSSSWNIFSFLSFVIWEKAEEQSQGGCLSPYGRPAVMSGLFILNCTKRPIIDISDAQSQSLSQETEISTFCMCFWMQALQSVSCFAPWGSSLFISLSISPLLVWGVNPYSQKDQGLNAQTLKSAYPPAALINTHTHPSCWVVNWGAFCLCVIWRPDNERRQAVWSSLRL